MDQFPYADTTACTLVPEPNSTYLAHTNGVPAIAPQNSSGMGLMMILSALQYQAPYMPAQYSNAAGQAGRAAYIQSGGKKMEDDLGKYGAGEAKDAGVTDTEAAIVFGAAKVARDRQLKINGPKIYDIKTNLTVNQNSGSVGFKYEW